MPGKRALLKVHLPAKPPESARKIACVLAVGQREGPIEVLDIDEAAGRVKVSNSDTVMVLTFEKDNSQTQTPPLLPDLLPSPIQSASRQ